MKPILPIVNGSYTYAIAFASNRVDGYLYKLDVPLEKIGLSHANGYSVEVSTILLVVQCNKMQLCIFRIYMTKAPLI